MASVSLHYYPPLNLMRILVHILFPYSSLVYAPSMNSVTLNLLSIEELYWLLLIVGHGWTPMLS